MAVFIVLGAICLVFTAILIADVSMTFAFERMRDKQSISVAMHWLHPLILRAAFDVKTRSLKLLLFGTFHLYPTRTEGITGGSAQADAAYAPQPSPSGSIDDTERLRSDEPVGIESPGTEAEPDHDAQDAGVREVAPKKRVPIRQRLRRIAEGIKRSAWMKALRLIRRSSWRSKILRWCSRCIRLMPGLISFRHADLAIRAGLADPSLTGSLFGFWTGLRSALASGGGGRLALTFDPVFTEECLFLKGNISFRSSLMRFAVLFAVAIGTFPYFSTIKAWRAIR